MYDQLDKLFGFPVTVYDPITGLSSIRERCVLVTDVFVQWPTDDSFVKSDGDRTYDEDTNQFMVAVDNPQFHESLDAREWSKTFMQLFGHRLAELDYEIMTHWFSHCIMRGYDDGYKVGSTKPSDPVVEYTL